jgi:hypothetical protein
MYTNSLTRMRVTRYSIGRRLYILSKGATMAEKLVYMDHNATTPLHPQVRKAMIDAGNIWESIEHPLVLETSNGKYLWIIGFGTAINA